MTQDQHRRIIQAMTETGELAEAKISAPNSYGAGYEQGFGDALALVLNTIDGREEAL